MSDNNITERLAQVRGLDELRWNNAETAARTAIKQKLVKPDPESFQVTVFGVLPANVIKWTNVLVCVVAFAAFWISAGKQLAATAMILDPLAQRYDHLSGIWSNLGDFFLLALGEAGALLFSLASSVLAGEGTFNLTVGKRILHINPTVLVFRSFAILCAGIALLANITITAMENPAGATVYAWFITLLPPLTVLGVGLVAERLIITALKARGEQRSKFLVALSQYESLYHDPSSHGEYKKIWYKSIYEELRRYKVDREKIDALVAEDSRVMGWLVQREVMAHDIWQSLAAEISTGVSTERPILPPLSDSSAGELNKPLGFSLQ